MFWNSVQLGVWMLAAIILFPTIGWASSPVPRSAAKFNPSPFYLGPDISTLSEIQRRGGIYMDGGKPGEALAIFVKDDWTCFRLRIWVDPTDGVNGLEYKTKLAKRIRNAASRVERETFCQKLFPTNCGAVL